MMNVDSAVFHIHDMLTVEKTRVDISHCMGMSLKKLLDMTTVIQICLNLMSNQNFEY